jgi:hypothetical protein
MSGSQLWQLLTSVALSPRNIFMMPIPSPDIIDILHRSKCPGGCYMSSSSRVSLTACLKVFGILCNSALVTMANICLDSQIFTPLVATGPKALSNRIMVISMANSTLCHQRLLRQAWCTDQGIPCPASPAWEMSKEKTCFEPGTQLDRH